MKFQHSFELFTAGFIRFMSEESYYEVKVSSIFEGPMDLLIHLIRRNEVDIYDIPIALITKQYLEYLEWMKVMNIDFAGDFILMASTLTQIKSKMLIPSHEEETDEDDPRLELVRPLTEYLQMKSVAEQLAERHFLGDDIFSITPAKEEFLTEPDDDMLVSVDLFELIDAFQKILENISGEHQVDFRADRISIKERISQLVDILEKQGSVTFNELLPENADKDDIIVTFLATLEMAKLCLIRIAQHVQTGIIRLFYL